MKFRKKKIASLSLSLLSAITLSAFAANPYVLVVPNCLLNQTDFHYQTLIGSNEFMLLKTDDAGLAKLIDAKTHEQATCGGFMDVTEAWQKDKSASFSANDEASFLNRYTQPDNGVASQPSLAGRSVKYPQQVNRLLSAFNSQMMWNNLTTLTSQFQDRFAKSPSGVRTTNWIKNQIETLAKNRSDVSIKLVNTGNYAQRSVVVKIGNSIEPGVVLGGHMDTLQAKQAAMPGADDDGTGAVTLLEVARVILSSNMQFKKPIYLIWYSAEEVGLVGSQHVVAYFKRQNIPVDGVMQFDMTGYAYNNDLSMWLITDYTNPELTSFTVDLINAYVKRPIQYTKCGYACSDHATWTQNGYKTAFPAEAAFSTSNPKIHSPDDTMSNITKAHSEDYAKLALAFAVEMAEPV